ncbi:MAG: enoyl-CoA hydratase/isomerase family protein [Cuniculiplasma sp.]
MNDYTIIKKNGNLSELLISREDRRNALNSDMQYSIINSIQEIEQDDTVRVVLVRSSGEDFSVGADIGELVKMDREMAEKFRENMLKITQLIFLSTKIYIFYLTGYSLGGALEMAQWSDIIIAHEKARIGQPEINIGINAGAGGNSILPVEVGYRNAIYMAVTGTIMSAMEAKQIGLVQEVVKTESEMLEIANKISTQDPMTLKSIKRTMRIASKNGYDEGMRVEKEEFVRLVQSRSTKDLLSRFLKK